MQLLDDVTRKSSMEQFIKNQNSTQTESSEDSSLLQEWPCYLKTKSGKFKKHTITIVDRVLLLERAEETRINTQSDQKSVHL